METRDTLAVVDTHCFYRARDWWSHGGIGSLDDLLSLAERAGLKHVWVVPGTLQNCSVPGETRWDIRAIYQNKKQEHYNFLRARHASQRHEENIYVGFPEFSFWPWEGDNSPKVLLATIANLEDALQLPFEWTPAHMSQVYTLKQNDAHRYWLKAPTIDLEQRGFTYGQIETEMHWPSEKVEIAVPSDATHYIDIDGNSAYAAAMTGLNVGEGDPFWCVPGPSVFRGDNPLYDGKKPGFWCVQAIKRASIFDGVKLPGFEERTWMTTDLIEQLRGSGYDFIIKYGWCWGHKDEAHKIPAYHQALRSTADSLWKLRVYWRKMSTEKPESKTCENVHETLRVVIKAVHGKQHPSVRVQVVARSVAMMVYRIEKIYKQFGILPIKIKVDGLRYAVSDPHIFDAMMDRDKLGGFKHVETVEIVECSKEPL